MLENLAVIAFLSLWMVLGLVEVLAIANFDKLVRLEYETRREAWEKDGGPLGTPPGTSAFVRRGRGLFFIWLVHTPDWIVGYPEAQKLLHRVRVFQVAVLLAFLILVGTIFGIAKLS